MNAPRRVCSRTRSGRWCSRLGPRMTPPTRPSPACARPIVPSVPLAKWRRRGTSVARHHRTAHQPAARRTAVASAAHREFIPLLLRVPTQPQAGLTLLRPRLRPALLTQLNLRGAKLQRLVGSLSGTHGANPSPRRCLLFSRRNLAAFARRLTADGCFIAVRPLRDRRAERSAAGHGVSLRVTQ